MDALLSLIPGGSLTAIGGAIVAALLAVWRVFAAGKKAGLNQARAKEADSYEQHLKTIEHANQIRDAVRRRNADPDRLHEDDGWRRD